MDLPSICTFVHLAYSWNPWIDALLCSMSAAWSKQEMRHLPGKLIIIIDEPLSWMFISSEPLVISFWRLGVIVVCWLRVCNSNIGGIFWIWSPACYTVYLMVGVGLMLSLSWAWYHEEHPDSQMMLYSYKPQPKLWAPFADDLTNLAKIMSKCFLIIQHFTVLIFPCIPSLTLKLFKKNFRF